MNNINTRRDFVKSLLGATTLLFVGNHLPLLANHDYSVIGVEKLWNLAGEFEKQTNLPLNELMFKIANKFIGTPYVGNTLEGSGGEMCRINFEGLDCITFYELVLCMARSFKKGDFDISSLVNEVTYVRYRGGVLDGYESRLHYTSDWIYDNVQKNVVKDITKSLGGIKFEPKVGFMSSNPDKYAALKDNPKLVKIIKKFEDEINSRKHYFIPKDEVKSIENELQNADIIAIVTSIKGLDYSHTGIISKSENGDVHLFHASTNQKKVIIDEPISEYLKKSKSATGISVIRPLEIK
ncbi:MAG: DUF1460 domain-containing protein [Desulfobulbaceae bacterium]|nr:DUF1460 domain-containing protein [Candidatus Kapabacteria bacterium]MBS4000110.1 DUF1460 domain-containing protein [Desulfobulbaceae bacterium]